MVGLDVICAQNWIEQFRYNLEHHEERPLAFQSYCLASLNFRFHTAYDFVFYAFDWSETAQHSDGTYFGPWSDRRDRFIAMKLLTR